MVRGSYHHFIFIIYAICNIDVSVDFYITQNIQEMEHFQHVHHLVVINNF